MRKIIVLVVALMTISSYSQAEGKNEVRLNAFSMLASRELDLSYEHFINDESAVGVSFAFALADKYNLFGIKQKYAVTPYYRYYAPDDVMKGLFLEAFMSINGGQNKIKYADLDDEEKEEIDITPVEGEEYIYPEYGDFAFGLGGGYKYVSDSGFVGELFAGVGRNLSGKAASPTVVPRVGLSFGFRF